MNYRDKFVNDAPIIVLSPVSWYNGCEGKVIGKQRTADGVDVAFTKDALRDLPENQRQSPVWFLYGSLALKTSQRNKKK